MILYRRGLRGCVKLFLIWEEVSERCTGMFCNMSWMCSGLRGFGWELAWDACGGN